MHNSDGETALTFAVKKKSMKALDQLLRSMLLDADATNSDGLNCFEVAIANDDKALGRYLLKHKWLGDFKRRLNYIIQADDVLPDPERCTPTNALLVLKTAPNLTEAQRKEYERYIKLYSDPVDESEDETNVKDEFDISKMLESISHAISNWTTDTLAIILDSFEIDAGICSLKGTDTESNDKTLKIELEEGFDHDTYNNHYDLSSDEQKESQYTKAMEDLIETLKTENNFMSLNKSKNFSITMVNHNY